MFILLAANFRYLRQCSIDWIGVGTILGWNKIRIRNYCETEYPTPMPLSLNDHSILSVSFGYRL